MVNINKEVWDALYSEDEPVSDKKQESLLKGRIVVLHAYYGCDTGCCGHIFEVNGIPGEFTFSHPYGEDFREWAEDLVRQEYGEDHVKDLDWENCILSDD
jgi:hypothetical protein